MNEYISLMINRSSVRHFEPNRHIPDSDIELIVTAGQRAASSYNLQTYSFISITDKEMREKITLLSENQPFINDASCFLIVCLDLYKMLFVNKKCGYDYYQQKYFESTLMAAVDTSLAGQATASAAESLGYGVCYIGGVRSDSEKIVELLGLPEKVFPLFGLCIGYPLKKNPPKPRLPITGVLHKNKYSIESVERAIKEYDEVMARSGIYENRQFPLDEVHRNTDIDNFENQQYGWIEHSARRTSTRKPSKVRKELPKIIKKQDLSLQ